MAKRRSAKANKKLAALCAVLILFVVAAALFAGGGKAPESGSVTPANEPVADELKVNFVDVGQGDCIFITCGSASMLIDAGDNGTEQTVINYLNSAEISKLDYVVATHPHTDHIGGMPEVLGKFDAANIIMPAVPERLTPTSKTYSDFLTAVSGEKSRGAKVISAKAGKEYALGGATFKILAPLTFDTDDLNNISVVIRLDYGETSFLFTGDASSDEEKSILASGADIDCDILKVGHHGSSTSSGAKFLSAVTPEAAVIMCGKDNSYNHPNEKTVARIKKQTDNIYRTDICSTVVITCGESGYTVDF